MLFLEVELFKAVLMSLKSSKVSYEEMLGFGLSIDSGKQRLTKFKHEFKRFYRLYTSALGSDSKEARFTISFEQVELLEAIFSG